MSEKLNGLHSQSLETLGRRFTAPSTIAISQYPFEKWYATMPAPHGRLPFWIEWSTMPN